MAQHEGSFLDAENQGAVAASNSSEQPNLQSLDNSWINNISDHSGTSCDENSLNSSFG